VFVTKLEFVFLAVVALALAFLSFNHYEEYSFKRNDVAQSFKQRIKDKERDVLLHMRENFGFVFQVPIIMTDKFAGRLYGLASYENGEIKIYRNDARDGGHSSEWKRTCVKLGGVDCQEYVNQHEIVMAKMPFK
jgi:SprT protein